MLVCATRDSSVRASSLSLVYFPASKRALFVQQKEKADNYLFTPLL